MKAALDTNLLVYFEDASDAGRRARALLQRLDPDRIVLPVQVAGELFNVLTRKSQMSSAAARQTVERWSGSFEVVGTTFEVLRAGIELASLHRLQIWDAIVLAAANEAGCGILLTEDLHDGFRWESVTVVNPFADKPSPLLDAFLGQARA